MVEDGYGVVGPVVPEVARTLLDIADAMGLSQDTVRTSIGGFIVPADVAERYEATLGAQPAQADEAEQPDESWKNDQIKAWAEAQGVDLGEATKKADMLAAIRATDKEE